MGFWGRVILSCAMAVLGAHVSAANNAVDDLRKEIDDLRRQLNNPAPEATIRSVDAISASHAIGADGPNNVTTRCGKLELGGLLQIWDQHIWQDRHDVFGSLGAQLIDNSGRRIRRAELKFTMDIHENITAVVMFDAAREATSFAPVPTNQGLFKSGSFAPIDNNGVPFASAPYQPVNSNGTYVVPPGTFPGVSGINIADQVRNGTGEGNRILQDAYINYHGCIPQHDFTIGQFKPPAGEEGVRSSANLDFIERAMINQLNDFRDLGIQVHGSWFEDCETKIGRLQYWVGAFDGAGNFFNTAGDFQNRSDDNDHKDIAAKLMVRPIWSDCL